MKLLIIMGLLLLNACSTTVTNLPQEAKPTLKSYSFKWNDKTILAKTSYNWKKIPTSLKRDHLKYTQWLTEEIKNSGLDKLLPKDAKAFGYRDGMDMVEFWGNILVEMAFWEGGWDTDSFYKESFGDSRGENVISRGLFQISVESGNNKKRSDCKLTSYKQLHDAKTNIWCSARIIAYFVKANGVISQNTLTGWKGPARYFSVLRGTRDYTKKALDAIKAANK